MNKDLHIRPLSLNELPNITRIHLQAFPKSALAALGSRGIDKYYEWLLTGPHDAIALGVYIDDTLIGFLFGGTFRGALSGFLRRNRSLLVRRVITRLWLIADPIFRDRLELGLRIILRRPRKSRQEPHQALREPSFGILVIAVNPQYQGYGAGKALMAKSEEAAREKGCRHMNLSVSKDNAQAIGFYEHLGWKRPHLEIWDGHMFKVLEGSISQAGDHVS